MYDMLHKISYQNYQDFTQFKQEKKGVEGLGDVFQKLQ